MDPENREACYDQLKHFFEPTPHSSEIQVLKQILEHQFNKSQPFTNRGDMADVINQVVLLKVNTVKEGLLYFTMCYKGKHFVPAMKEFQRLSEYKGQRLKNVHLLTKFLDQNSYTPIGNPITDLKENAVRMFDRKDMLNNSVFQFFSLSDAKKLFFNLINTSCDLQLIARSFLKLSFIYINKSKQGLIPKNFRNAWNNLEVSGQQRYCYVYFCEKGSHPKLKNHWIMAVQTLKPSILNIDKTIPSFEREDYIADPLQIEENEGHTFNDINHQNYASQQKMDKFQEPKKSMEQSEQIKEQNLQQKIIFQRRQSSQIQDQFYGSTSNNRIKKINEKAISIGQKKQQKAQKWFALIIILLLVVAFAISKYLPERSKYNTGAYSNQNL